MYRSQTQLRASWRQAFDSVIDIYVSVKSTHGSNRNIDYQKLEQTKGNSSHKIVRPSPSDFICDVELAAAKTLNEVELIIFRQCFMEFTHDPDTVKEKYMTSIKEKLGLIFMEKLKIYPTSSYFKGKYIR